MGILGLTHDDKGVALERLPVTIKVAIGEGPQPGEQNGHPRRLDHFVFKRKTLRGQDVVWDPATDIAKVYGEKPTELGIIFLNDDPREAFRTEYAWWTPTGYKCHGELVQIENGSGVRYEMRAIRRTQKHPGGEPWPGSYKYVEGSKKGQPVPSCGDGCPDLERGDCRPSGDLYFMLEKLPTLGAVCRLHTSSYRSIRNLSNGLMQIRRFNGGRLTGIKAVLKATPERIWYSDGDGVRHSSVAHILSLEIAATDIAGLVASMTEPVRLLEQGRGGFRSNGKVQYVVRETDAERAEEIPGTGVVCQKKAKSRIAQNVVIDGFDLMRQRVHLGHIHGVKRVELIGIADAEALDGQEERLTASGEVARDFRGHADAAQVVRGENLREELLRLQSDRLDLHPLAQHLNCEHSNRLRPEVPSKYVPRLCTHK